MHKLRSNSRIHSILRVYKFQAKPSDIFVCHNSSILWSQWYTFMILWTKWGKPKLNLIGNTYRINLLHVLIFTATDQTNLLLIGSPSKCIVLNYAKIKLKFENIMKSETIHSSDAFEKHYVNSIQTKKLFNSNCMEYPLDGAKTLRVIS